MSSVELVGVAVSRGGQRVLSDLDLGVADGERVAILGASGSGKTTLLRVVAGVEPVESGRILIDRVDVTDAAPRDRNVGMITQEGGLQPHLDVEQNLGFALRLRRLAREEVDTRVRAEARAFSLTRLLRRRPQTLSAGQRHEVAVARALVRRASVLLADEPFAQIDPRRRETMLRELIRVQEGYGVTLLVATNDQRIALGLGQRLAVLARGRIVQIGTPTELFRRPATAFVAGFLGEDTNLLDGRLDREGGRTVVRVAGTSIPTWDLALTRLPPQPVRVAIRPADIEVAGPGRTAPLAPLDAVVERTAFLGGEVLVTTATADGTRLQLRQPAPGPGVGDRLDLAVPPAAVHVFNAVGDALAHGV